MDCSRLTLEKDTKFTLCLPQTCTTVQTATTDDCWSLSAQHNLSFPQFMAYNPSLNSDCTNLRVPDTVICVSSPDGSYTPAPLPGSNSSWTLGEYAEALVPAPGIVPFGTTDQCGGYYQVQAADTCRRISLAAKVSIPLFREINPSVDTDCTNLVPGLWYCVHPTYDWNITTGDDGSGGPTSTSSTPVAAPGPTPTGTTQECYKWHMVVSGDNCQLLQNTLGVTMAQLVAWNPNLKADCSNLMLDAAYCVQGPPLPSASTSSIPLTTTTSTTTTTKSTTTSSSSSSPTPTTTCTQTYTVSPGDYCSLIWTQFSLTESLFRTLNPTLNAACDISIGQILCVGTPSTCKTTYTVVAGDWCAKIWEEFNLTEQQFRALNPELGAECGIQVGQRVCVG